MKVVCLLVPFLILSLPLAAQQMTGMKMGGEAGESAAAEFLADEASGTGVNPSSVPMAMSMVMRGPWMIMYHGLAFINGIEQSRPEGRDGAFSTNWFMTSLQRDFQQSSLMFRAMLSLEPATVADRKYPELFQTGETAYGQPIVNGQHPHDFFMELSVQWVRQLAKNTVVDFYFAPVGDPALGPVAYPHRASAAEIPQATLSHHLQDSTHIANEVVTVGLKTGMIRLEGSGFHGGEPDEQRWDIDHGPIDSWSGRLTVTPSANWVAQVSAGRLKHPEALEPDDITRSTASVTYARPSSDGVFSASFIWGRNHRSVRKTNADSFLLEALYRQKKNNFTGRIELVDKDELFPDTPPALVGKSFRIDAFTLGYARDFRLVPFLATGAGANFTFYHFPSALTPVYGDHPVAFLFYFRFLSAG